MTQTKVKSKYRIKWNIVIPLVICVLLVLYLVISLIVGMFKQESKDKEIYKICSYTGNETYKAVLSEERNNPIELLDYAFYGESMIFTFDSIDSYTICFVDMCSQEEIKFTIDSDKIDKQIDLSQLKAGYYAVYVVNGDNRQRIYLANKIIDDDIFYTVTKNSQVSKIELIADKALYDTVDAKENMLDRNYLYVKVQLAASSENEQYDIAIISSPLMTGMKAISEYGEENNGLVEAKEMYQLAVEIHTKLQLVGYKSVILKDSFNEKTLYYGQGGLLEKAYNMHVKYLIVLDMGISNAQTGVIYSLQADGELANKIFSKLATDTTFGFEDSELRASRRSVKDDVVYDEEFEIREAGGTILKAGKYSVTSEKNISFASNNIYGINTVKIVLTNINDAESVKLWNENKEKTANAIGDAIIEYLNK